MLALCCLVYVCLRSVALCMHACGLLALGVTLAGVMRARASTGFVSKVEPMYTSMFGIAGHRPVSVGVCDATLQMPASCGLCVLHASLVASPLSAQAAALHAMKSASGLGCDTCGAALAHVCALR